ncbi:DNA primase [Alicyclobacillus tolerans]|uniref:DNA primase n=1 Tax=Alicyclobacillus TaxID=29330 RepID=UPI001932EFA8|nr:DNA primase [Alicyclobacillus sp. TC]QRF23124.1 DNA primase [Alicyclobacillus sp. TC]
MQKLPNEFLEELRQRIDIVDIISEHVELRKTGHSFTGLCPFHNERTPSFSVSPDRQMFHCFGCGAGGTVIRFVMEHDGLSFMEAVEVLATRAGMSLPAGFVVEPTINQQKTQIRERLLQANELAAKYYTHILMNSDAGVQALKYLNERMIQRTTAVEFQLGYSPNQANMLMRFLSRRGYSPEELELAGLIVRVGGEWIDRFRHRLMIPIFDIRGQVVGFGGRALEPGVKPKYLNTPETLIFHKGHLLFQHGKVRKQIRSKRHAYLFEGYMDVMAAWQAGIDTGVASLGTSLTPEQARLLKRDCHLVTVVYDGDAAGISAAKRAVEVFETEGLEVRIVQLPDGRDPDEFIREFGTKAFHHQLQVNALTPLQFLTHSLRTTADLLSSAGRQQYMRHVMQLLAARASPIEKEAELRNLSQEFNFSLDSLKEEMRIIEKKTHRQHRRIENKETLQVKPLEKGFIEAGQRILQWMMLDNDAFAEIESHAVDELATPEQTALLALLYHWRLTSETSIETFVDELEEEDLRKLASALLIDNSVPFDKRILEDYLRTIRSHILERSYKEAIAEVVQAQLAGNSALALEIKSRVDALMREMEALKSTRFSVAVKGGDEEARMR